jgi:hypothetical protein
VETEIQCWPECVEALVLKAEIASRACQAFWVYSHAHPSWTRRQDTHPVLCRRCSCITNSLVCGTVTYGLLDLAAQKPELAARWERKQYILHIGKTESSGISSPTPANANAVMPLVRCHKMLCSSNHQPHRSALCQSFRNCYLIQQRRARNNQRSQSQ